MIILAALQKDNYIHISYILTLLQTALGKGQKLTDLPMCFSLLGTI